MCAQSLSNARLFLTLWIVACQAFLCPWNFPGKNNWNGLPFPSLGDLLDRDQIHISYIAGGFFTCQASWKPQQLIILLPLLLQHNTCISQGKKKNYLFTHSKNGSKSCKTVHFTSAPECTVYIFLPSLEQKTCLPLPYYLMWHS